MLHKPQVARSFVRWLMSRPQQLLGFAESSVLSSARASLSNNSSISAGLMISGGQIVTHSPAMKRTIRPSASAWCTTAAPMPCFGLNGFLVAPVAGELDRADDAHAACLADERMIGEHHQALLELRRARAAVSIILSRLEISSVFTATAAETGWPE